MAYAARRPGFFLILCFSLSLAYGQADIKHIDDFLLKIAVINPGDEIYMWWGHIVLAVEDTGRGTIKFYNWGTFTSPSGNFLKDFINGELLYSVSSGYLDIKELLAEDWDISVYTLNLDRKARGIILSYLENSVLTENRYYDYREFSDNCSTRIRDIINMGTGGQFKAASGSSGGRLTLRQHIRRFTCSKPFADWMLDFFMGQNFDQKITPWEEMFLPVEIANKISDFSYIDESGAERKLVSSVQVFNSSKKRPPVPNEPMTTWPFFMTAGLITALLLFFLNARRNRYPRSCRILSGVIQSILGLFFGASGCILFFGLFYMKNDMIQQNINILFVNPLLLFIVPLGIMAAFNKARPNPGRFLRIIWTCVFIAGIITLLLGVLPFFYQQNQSVCGLVLPIAFALSDIPEKAYKLFTAAKKTPGG